MACVITCLRHICGVHHKHLSCSSLLLREMPGAFLHVDFRLTSWILFSCPALLLKPWCEVGLSMNFLVLCVFIYKMRLLQPRGRINNDLSNIMQLSARAKTGIREITASQSWKEMAAGATWSQPIWRGRAASRMGRRFSLGRSPRTWGCSLFLSSILGFCSLVCVWCWGATVFDSRERKNELSNVAYAWTPCPSMKQHYSK